MIIAAVGRYAGAIRDLCAEEVIQGWSAPTYQECCCPFVRSSGGWVYDQVERQCRWRAAEWIWKPNHVGGRERPGGSRVCRGVRRAWRCRDGVKSGDTIEFHNSVGTATFAQETRNQGVASAITIVAAGAGLTAAAFGAPELTPLITAAGAQVAKQFPEKKENAKARDVYGQIPGSSQFARQEGGLLICSPAVQGIWHSGDDDDESRWIRSSKDRGDPNLPAHVKDAFFLRRSAGARTLVGDGEMIIAPWDFKFGDNVGVYRVNFILRRKGSDNVIE